MFSGIRFIRKRRRQVNQISGFTLIELLVALIIAALIITPLLGFLVDVLTTDHREQAKTATEQDLQGAIDYISHDLEQAVYIYDGTGIQAIQTQLPTSLGTPALVFWKREPVANAISQSNGVCPSSATAGTCNDSFVYAIVAYYLTDNSGNNDPQWSTSAHITRLEMKDGVKNPTQPLKSDNKTPNYLYVAPDPRAPDLGFKLFDLTTTSGTLESKMNKWISNNAATNFPTPNVLIDYVDQSQTATAVQTQVDCQKVLGITAATVTLGTTPPSNLQLTTTGPQSVNKNNYTSFYACVDSSKTVAQIYIRGNALIRSQSNGTYSLNSPYFPTASVKIKGRGFLYTQ